MTPDDLMPGWIEKFIVLGFVISVGACLLAGSGTKASTPNPNPGTKPKPPPAPPRKRNL